MPQFQAIITTHVPHKKGDADFELPYKRLVQTEAKDENAALDEFHILADAEQRARRAKTKLAVTCRFEVLKQAAPDAK